MMNFAVCAYSLPHVMGYLKTADGNRCAKPLMPVELMNWAQARGLAGVEIPLEANAPVFDGQRAEVGKPFDAKAEAQLRKLRLIADYGSVVDRDWEHLRDYITLAAQNGAKTVRVLLSYLLCGDRRSLLPQSFWEARQEHIERLKLACDHAATLGVCIAVENHQDVTCDELLGIWERLDRHPAYGILMDTGNPLAVGESPISFVQRAGHLIRHLHLKDYTIHFAPNGYRLVRCAAGDGCVDFPSILKTVAENEHDVLPAIEIAAQATRTIPILEADWWQTFAPEQSQYLPGALQTLWAHGIGAETPYSSAWERGECSENVCAEEWALLEKSVAYFHALSQQSNAPMTQ
jgi:3-oxoisoapionate decarboxylase